MNDSEFKRIFQQQKHEIPDDGFSEKVLRRLPRKLATPLWEKGLRLLFWGVILFMTIQVVLSLNFSLIITYIQQLTLFFSKALSILFLHPVVFMALFFVLLLSLTGYLLREKSY